MLSLSLRTANILVRAYESRLDLLRVLIIGPLGTPFQNAPFLFDLFLPPAKFPQEPPKVFFHSWAGGTRVSPNLYSEGKVCLSLLGTWSGDKTEVSRWIYAFLFPVREKLMYGFHFSTVLECREKFDSSDFDFYTRPHHGRRSLLYRGKLSLPLSFFSFRCCSPPLPRSLHHLSRSLPLLSSTDSFPLGQSSLVSRNKWEHPKERRPLNSTTNAPWS